MKDESQSRFDLNDAILPRHHQRRRTQASAGQVTTTTTATLNSASALSAAASALADPAWSTHSHSISTNDIAAAAASPLLEQLQGLPPLNVAVNSVSHLPSGNLVQSQSSSAVRAGLPLARPRQPSIATSPTSVARHRLSRYIADTTDDEGGQSKSHNRRRSDLFGREITWQSPTIMQQQQQQQQQQQPYLPHSHHHHQSHHSTHHQLNGYAQSENRWSNLHVPLMSPYSTSDEENDEKQLLYKKYQQSSPSRNRFQAASSSSLISRASLPDVRAAGRRAMSNIQGLDGRKSCRLAALLLGGIVAILVIYIIGLGDNVLNAVSSWITHTPPPSDGDAFGVFSYPDVQKRMSDAWTTRLGVQASSRTTLPVGYTAVNPARVCIMQADDRPLGSDPAKGPFWTSTAYATAWYSMLHGYRYLRVPSQQRPGYYQTWGKLRPMLDTLRDYDYVMFLDSDAFVIQPQLSLDALRLRWGLKDDFAWLMQEDPDMYTRWDGQRDRVANTGFWILKNDPRTFAMLLDLIECPSRHEGCGVWKQTRFHEQSAFNDYIRRDYHLGTDFVMAPCDETFGSPTDSDCHGTIIRHRAGRKSSKYHLTEYVNEMMLQAMYGSIQASMSQNTTEHTLAAFSRVTRDGDTIPNDLQI